MSRGIKYSTVFKKFLDLYVCQAFGALSNAIHPGGRLKEFSNHPKNGFNILH